jgi:RNA 3'-terminal phosphate cyclase (ATP)
MGLKSSLITKKYGYYPKGLGEINLKVDPSKLTSIDLNKPSEAKYIEGISICTFLEKQQVGQRQAQEATRILKKHELNSKIKVKNDKSNPLQKGSSITLWAKKEKKFLLGGDAIGELYKSSEKVGKEATHKLVKEIKSRATVDIHLADMLIPYIALAKGSSTYLTRKLTDHIDTNIWVVRQILDTEIQTKKVDNLYEIQKN